MHEVFYFGLRDSAKEEKATEYLLAQSADTLFVSFAGTNDKSDWYQNLNIRYRPLHDSPYVAHEGYLQSWQEVKDAIVSKINKQSFKRIVVSGHSKGGAVGLLAAYDLLDAGFPVKKAYTFGSPLVFNIPSRDDVSTFTKKVAQDSELKFLHDNADHYIREKDYIQIASTTFSSNTLTIGQQFILHDDGTVKPRDLQQEKSVFDDLSLPGFGKMNSTTMNHHADTYLELLKEAKQ